MIIHRHQNPNGQIRCGTLREMISVLKKELKLLPVIIMEMDTLKYGSVSQNITSMARKNNEIIQNKVRFSLEHYKSAAR